MSEKTIEDLSGVALAAAYSVCPSGSQVLTGLGIAELDKLAEFDGAVKFIRYAGDAPAESVYRWGAANGLHFLPADGWAKVSPDIRLFFDAFTAVVKALAPIIDPPPATIRAPIGVEAPRRVEDTVFERHDDAGAKADGGGKVLSTDQVKVIPMQDAANAVPGGVAADGPVVYRESEDFSRVATMSVDAGEPRMTVQPSALDQLRAERRANDPNDVLNILKERPEAGPEAEPGAPQHVEATVGGEKIEGEATVSRPATSKKK